MNISRNFNEFLSTSDNLFDIVVLNVEKDYHTKMVGERNMIMKPDGSVDDYFKLNIQDLTDGRNMKTTAATELHLLYQILFWFGDHRPIDE